MKLKASCNKIVLFLKKNYFLVISFFTIVMFFVINYFMICSKLGMSGYERDEIVRDKVLYIAISAVLTGVIFSLLRISNKQRDKYTKLFVIFAVVMGVSYLLLSPLFTGSDEQNHYYRIYEITEGVMVTPTGETYSGGNLPASLSESYAAGSGNNAKIKYQDISDMAKVPLDKDNETLYSSEEAWHYYSNTSLYSPVTYSPHILGFMLGKLLKLNPYMIGMLGRLFNLLSYVLIGYFAIKLLPKWRLFYFLILLSPNMLQCATTLSADAFMNALALLFLALIMKARFAGKMVTRGWEIMVGMLGIVLSLCKICYAPLMFMILLIKDKQFMKGRRERILFTVLVLMIVGLLNLFWISKTGAIFDAAYPQTASQKEFIMAYPLGYLVILLRSFVNWSVEIVECLFVGRMMYHAQLEIPTIISFAYVGLVMLALMKEKTVGLFSRYEKLGVVLAGTMMSVLIFTALYLQCTAQFFGVGNPLIMGVQGRYFIPLIFCLPFVINNKKSIKCSEKKLVATALCINLVVWFYMMCQFVA